MTSLAPEQVRALRYLEKRGTQSTAAAVKAAVRDAFGTLESVLEGVDAAKARRPPPAGGWSVQAVVDHLVLSHRPAVAQLRASLAGEDPGEAVPADLQSDDPLATSWEDRAAALISVHSDLLSVLETATDEQVGVPIPLVMVIKGKDANGETVRFDWLERLDWKAYSIGIKAHSLEHAAQVRRVLGALDAGQGT